MVAGNDTHKCNGRQCMPYSINSKLFFLPLMIIIIFEYIIYLRRQQFYNVPANIPNARVSPVNNSGSNHTARNAQVAITKPISGCVHIACSGLMITSLLQVVNRLAASCELYAGLMQVDSSTSSKSANIRLQQV